MRGCSQGNKSSYITRRTTQALQYRKNDSHHLMAPEKLKYDPVRKQESTSLPFFVRLLVSGQRSSSYQLHQKDYHNRPWSIMGAGIYMPVTRLTSGWASSLRTRKIYKLHLRRIKEALEVRKKKFGREFTIRDEEILAWAEKHFISAEKNHRQWNGR
jgi:hypothetical protein